MSTKFSQKGEVMEYANSGSAIDSGAIVVIGERIGVARVDIDATSGSGSVEMEGVFTLPKATGTAWSQGDKLFYDASAGKLTKTATANTPAGFAFEAAASGDTTGKCKINQASPKQMPVQAAVSTADGSDAATTQALANALKTAHNDLLTKLKQSGLMANA